MNKIIGNTVGTPYNPNKLKPTTDEIKQIVDDYLVENPPEIEESDPTVPDWAKQPEKPTYTAEEVGARSDTWMPTAADVGARPKDWVPTLSDLGGITPASVESMVSAHNVNGESHNDLRLALSELNNRLNAIADSEDVDLNQLSEIVAYIKSNKTLIDAITTGKVSVSDIVDNLTTNVTNKPLSAAQGVALKALIEAITVPTKLSDLAGDSSHRTVTDAEKSAWDAKSDFDGKYSSLEGTPTIPTVPTNVSSFNNDAGYLKDTQLPAAINTALAQAKASGAFDGYTPIKGTDYFTPADKTELVNAVLEALPVAEEVAL